MKKLITITVIFITFFFFDIHPVKALTPQSENTWYEDIWDSIKGTFTDIFDKYIAPKFTIEPEQHTIDTDYNSQNQIGIAKKSIPANMDEGMKISYIESCIDNDSCGNQKLATCAGTEINLEDLIYYKLKNNSLQIKPELRTKFLSKSGLTQKGTPDCLDSVWLKLRNTPDKDSDATLQGNQIVREIIPKNSQIGDSAPKNIRQDTGVHTDLFHMNMIPASVMPTSAEERTLLFNQLMWPASQQQTK